MLWKAQRQDQFQTQSNTILVKIELGPFFLPNLRLLIHLRPLRHFLSADKRMKSVELRAKLEFL